VTPPLRARSFHFALDAALQHAGVCSVEQTMQYAGNPLQVMAQVTREYEYNHAVCQNHSFRSFGTANTTQTQERSIFFMFHPSNNGCYSCDSLTASWATSA